MNGNLSQPGGIPSREKRGIQYGPVAEMWRGDGLCSLRWFRRNTDESFGPINVEGQPHPVPGHAGQRVLEFRISRGSGKRGTSPGLLPAAFSGGLRCTGLDRHPDGKHGHGIFSWPLIEANASCGQSMKRHLRMKKRGSSVRYPTLLDNNCGKSQESTAYPSNPQGTGRRPGPSRAGPGETRFTPFRPPRRSRPSDRPSSA
jgi:hypothetical protein